MLALSGAMVGASIPAQAGTAAPGPAGGPPSQSANGATDHSLVAPSGTCNVYRGGTLGDFCLWYLQNFTGSKTGVLDNTPDLRPVTFQSAGAGQGQSVFRNAESDVNYDSLYTVRVFTGLNYTGTSGVVPPQTGGNFNPTFRNNVASFFWTR